ncbi:hypothetical protein QFZ24_009969 [Streptomyces phaeochromogenes]|jgi:hypothetical protein|uniref:hypothetical protein n=1 Tax=Streptomyces phaeochromogenes TaxID=1923 RepID=UPI00278F8E58|nr:hypothetical protein [Streptomyces phaeochromogenes]MDQ0955960.1 hypothetical protein [Streptomyces phaeochromogenes]
MSAVWPARTARGALGHKPSGAVLTPERRGGPSLFLRRRHVFTMTAAEGNGSMALMWMRSSATEWLAAASEDPRGCKREWRLGIRGVALLPAGRLWDVVIVPEKLGLCVADILDDLPLLRPGPVLWDARRHQVGFFVPPGTASRCADTGLSCASSGVWITAPAPHHRWGSLRWLVPPDGAGTLNRPEVLELTLKRAAE